MIGTLIDSENSLSVLNNHKILNCYLSSYNNLHVRNIRCFAHGDNAVIKVDDTLH